MATSKSQMTNAAKSIKDLFDELTKMGMAETFAQRVIERAAPVIVEANTSR